jgi:hypothetical protein
MNWKTLVKFILPMIELAGEDYIGQDENETGKDDAIGQSLVYVAKLLKAILTGKDLPKAPEVLK